jgi:hypothetical protein
MATSETYPVYEARVGALGSVRAWHLPDSNTYCFTYFNGWEYTPVFLSEEASYYTWLFLSMMHPEANGHIFPSECGKGYKHKTKSVKCKPAKKKPTVKKRQVKAK